MNGTAQVQIGEESLLLSGNESTYIRLDRSHRLETRARCRWN